MSPRPSSAPAAFAGWPAEAFSFYEGLEADNSKAYWVAHKDAYDRCVKAPMDLLSAAVAEEFSALKVFRPYRDVRFSADKTPYKTACGAAGEGEGGTAFYVQVSAQGLFVGSGYYRMANDQLARFRAAVADEATGAAFVAAIEAVRGVGLDVGGDALKVAPRGYPRDHPRVEWLKHKGLFVSRSFGVAKWLGTARALDRVVATWRDAAPVNAWMDGHVGPSELPPADLDRL